MATSKKVTVVEGGDVSPQQEKKTFVPTAESKGKATQLRLFAVLLWILGIGAEAGAIFYLYKVGIHTNMDWVWFIGLIVLDLILVIIGSQLWKKANRFDPASRKETVKFFLQNQLGVIISVIAFLPLVIVIFTNKDLDGKQKGILGAIAVVALLAAGISSADFSPPSVEEYTEQTNQIEELTGGNHVYWTKSGTKYHIYDNCQHINTSKTDEIFEGTVAQARELKNITELCKTCEEKAKKAKALSAPVIPQPADEEAADTQPDETAPEN
ncbi:MAG: hypothetical protein LBR50_02520 [Tannerella sp.]|jgi:hypothetical protein|nr:hypothetical protein [Tannerella sp.]